METTPAGNCDTAPMLLDSTSPRPWLAGTRLVWEGSVAPVVSSTTGTSRSRSLAHERAELHYGWAKIAVAVAVVAIMVLSPLSVVLGAGGAYGGFSGTLGTSAVGLSASNSTPTPSLATRGPTPSSVNIGQFPQSEPVATPQLLAAHPPTASHPTGLQLNRWNNVTNASGQPGWGVLTAPVHSAGASMGTAARPGLRTSTTLLTATAIGKIESIVRPNQGISGASVTPESLGLSCPQTTCAPVYSKPSFSVVIAVPTTEILVQAGGYLNNYTILTNITSGSTINVGVIYLTPLAYVYGTVVGCDPTHEPVPDVQATGVSRDGRIIAAPDSITNSRGYFNTTVPPGPSEVTFTPVLGNGLYFGSNLFVSLQPGQVYNAGRVCLQVGVVVTATLYSSTTGQKIYNWLGAAFAFAAARACERDDVGVCFNQGSVVGEPSSPATVSPETIAPATADLITFYATGYMANTTYITVPQLSPGHVYNIGRVNLIENGIVELTPTLTYAKSAANAISKWGTGLIWEEVCSLDGFKFSQVTQNTFGGFNMTENECQGGQGCSPVGAPVGTIAAPLRNSIQVNPDITGVCSPSGVPTWPIPGMLPVTDNMTYLNSTPGRILNTGDIGLTPGTYVLGTVSPATGLWSASDCSTDELNWCPAASPGNTYDLAYNISYGYNHLDEDPAGCPATYYYFCVAVTPGPSSILITGVTSTSNSTTVYAPPGVWSQMPLPLALASPKHVLTVNLTGAQIIGHVLDGLTGQVLDGSVTVSITAAGANVEPVSATVADATGAYSIPALPGWVEVHASSSNFLTNSTWVYVGSGTVRAQTIYLTPESFVTGQVLGPSGYPLNTSSVVVCPISNKGTGCVPILGSGLTNTNGTYYALVAAGPLPLGAYLIVANAPGYLSNSTWVNVTEPGQEYTADTIVLQPILGSIAASPHSPHRAATNASAAYVYGYVVDNATGLGVPSASISLDPVGGGTPILQSGAVSDIGQFNITVSVGSYWFNVTYPGVYYPWSGFLVVNGSVPYINESTIRLVHLGYLRGRIVVDPWRDVVSTQEGIGVQSLVTVSNPNHEITSQGDTDTGGFFNISASNAAKDLVFAVGLGGGQGTARQGFMENDTKWNVTKNGSLPFFIMGEVIYTAFTGLVRDASTNNATPVRFASVALTVATPNFATFTYTETLGGGGGYTIFMPPGNITVGLTPAAQISAYMPHNFTYNFPLAWFADNLSLLENISAAEVWQLPNVSLTHFGWIDVQVATSIPALDTSTSVVPYAVASATVITKNATSVSSPSTTADADGYLNMTAPVGTNLSVAFSAPDFNSSIFLNVSVNESATTYLNGSQGFVGTILLQPWGWVWGTVVDSLSGMPLYSAGVTVSNPNGTGSPGVTTNGAGFFMSDAPPGAVDQVAVTLNGYITNNTQVKVKNGGLGNLTPLNMTGLGVVAGRVLGYPGNAPVYGATVSVCPIAAPLCQNSNATTNGTGYFWVQATPGRDAIFITAAGYSENTTPGTILVVSDTWEWAGVFVIDQYSTVIGTVLGNPSGLALDAANASICSTVALPGAPAGPCFVTVLTNAEGQFSLNVPYGSYILSINDTNYNGTYLPVALAPGETLSVGTVFLEQYGAVQGVILGQDTDAPVTGALIQACEVWSVDNCTGFVGVSASGAYALSGPPGPYVLIAAGPNYQDAYVSTTFLAGITTSVFPIYLLPTGTSLLYTVQGRVVGGANLTPLDGAVVTAGSNYATATNVSGGFSLSVPWGTYLLTAQQNGYSAESRSVTVHADLSGMNFVLPQAVYSVSGTIRDGLTGNPVEGAGVTVGGTQLAASEPSGAYAISLPNGTFTVVITPPATSPENYVPVSFTVGVSGAPVVRDLLLYPGSAVVSGLVVDSLTGAPVRNATVVVTGTTEDGLPIAASTLITTATGTFSLPVYFGTYQLNASADGYLRAPSAAVRVQSSAPVPVTLALTPVSPAASTPTTGFGIGSALLLAGIAAVAVVAYLGVGPWRTASTDSGPVSRGPVRAERGTVREGTP